MKQILFCLIITFYVSAKAQQIKYVDFKTATINVSLNPEQKCVTGSIDYALEVIKKVDSIYIDAINMTFTDVNLNGETLQHHNDKKKLWIIYPFKEGEVYTVSFNYKATPKKALYFLERDKDYQIWTQGQGKYTSNWLPSFDDMNEKVEFDLNITYSKNYEVISNGKLISKEDQGDKTIWHYNMEAPMSSYLVALAIGKYSKEVEISKRGIPLKMYYYPKDSLRVAATYRYSKQMFDFLETEIGVAYPWQNYKQIPVKDFLYAGMENTGATIFADSFVTDSIGFNDRNYVNVNAHELAHQWFGDLVTETSGTHHWLQEGFATYYALLAEKEIFGDTHFYWQLYENAQLLHNQDIEGQGTSLLDPKSSSLTFYQRGAWVLHMLRENVGDDAFKSAIKNYLLKHQFNNVETQDFISELEKVSGKDLTHFAHQWILAKTFPYEKAILNLKGKTTLISEYEMVDCEVWNSKCDEHLKYPISDKAKIKLISQRPNRITSEMFVSSLKVRQSIAINLRKIPVNLKVNYETLLNDDSYQTIEAALFNLWSNFENDRIKYLNKTKDLDGFSDKNIRTLWLALAIVTPNYLSKNKTDFIKELTNYTSSEYGFEIRKNAFRYLNMIRLCNQECVQNLEYAKSHHNWRFSNFAKNLRLQN